MAYSQKVISSPSTGNPSDFVSSLTVLNKAGAIAQIGTPTVTVKELSDDGYVREAHFAGQPTNGDAGYSTGALFINTTGGTNVTIWVNEGTTSSATWFALDQGSGGSGGGLSIPFAETDSITTTGVSIGDTGTALTTGSLFSGTVTTGVFTTGGAVYKANLSAAIAGNGFVAVTTGAYTGTGLLVLTANSATTGTIEAISATGLTSGAGLTVTGGSVMTTAGALITTTHTGANGSAMDVLATGVFVDTTGLTSVIANSLTTGSLEVASATGQTSGVLYSITGGGSNITTGIILDLEMGAATAGTGLKVLTSGVFAGSNNLALFSATAATTTTGIVSIQGTGLTSGSGLLVTGGGANTTATGKAIEIAMGAATAGIGLSVTSTGVYATGSAGLIDVVANSATTTTGLVQVSATGLTTGSAVLVTGSGATLASGGKLLELAMGAATTGNGLTVTSTGAYTAAAGNALVNVVANSATSGAGLVQISGTGLTSGTALLVTGGGANITSGSAVARVSMGAATTGMGLIVSTSAAYTGIAGNGVIRIDANSATTTAGLLQVSGTGLTTGTGVLVQGTAATLTTGFYFAANDGALNAFTVGANGHLTSNQTTAPTIATNATGLSAVAVTAGSTDVCGTITSTGTPASGTVITLTFNKTYTTAPKVCLYTPANAAAGGINTMPIVTTTATTAVFTWPGSGVYAATPSWTYLVIA